MIILNQELAINHPFATMIGFLVALAIVTIMNICIDK